MTEALAAKTCTPCRGGVPPLSRQEAERFHNEARDWALLDDAHRIERTFRFRNFREALDFVGRVGELAEAEGHHPDIHISWNRVRLELTTHAIKGLSENDFVVAAKVDVMHNA